jgi:glycosyltransferase involved in cell wall biosynthesis
MKLGYLLSQYPTAGHTFMLREVVRLRSLGWSVEVVAVRPPGPGATLSPVEADEVGRTFYITRAGVRVVLAAQVATFFETPSRYVATWWRAIRMADWHPAKILSHTAYFMEAVVAGRHLRARGVEHVHTHFSSTVGFLVQSLFPLTLSITFHGPDEFENPAGFRLGAKVDASRFLVAISRFARSQIIRYAPGVDPDAIHVVPLGVDVSRLTPIEPRTGPGTFRLVTAGRLAPVKGHRILFEALAELRRTHPDVVLHVAGDGPERERLREAVRALGLADHVVFEGLLDQSALEALYRTADAFVLSSFAEGVPVVLMEAMAMQIPCVSTWVNGVPELIEHERDGLLVPPGDAASLATALARLMDDEGLRSRLGRAARAKVEQAYDVDANVRRLAAVFARRLGPPSTPAAFESTPVTIAATR